MNIEYKIITKMVGITFPYCTIKTFQEKVTLKRKTFFQYPKEDGPKNVPNKREMNFVFKT
jgi:hypothetical protein